MLESIRTIREASLRDFMTGLYNRRYFYQIGEPAVQRAHTGGTLLSLAMLDVDKFKAVNDTYGHDAGDAVLKALATLLTEHLRPQETAFRIGGEEFCLLFPGVGRDQLAPRLEALRAALQALPIMVGDKRLQVTASFGATSQLATSLDSMLRVADTCLYEAKLTGRNRVVMAGEDGKPMQEPA
jgi:diguanylate cyclase (GGDEF)-like protein